ncbi:MAG TPA: NADH-quinone oxidoreductase subunit NuoE [Anaerolineaceae bacterium]|nr:NADH-quinone oxidoreductase subunit NuoE [Anaerolineaceae bacterium]HPC06885.1 NADH-quinone oxidoreductase subunit NuoE [Anaerolineaceae bacterium]HQP08017.1 NADH-quinone oxidoreductase subunit NuoE [Anaerolineaceae bacterium]
MVLGATHRSDIEEVVNEVVQQYGSSRDELIPILNEINRKVGFLPNGVLEMVSKQLKLPQSKVLSVATFYQMLSTKPRGRHVIQFCESAPCHVTGGRQVWERLQEELNIKAGETTEDDKWSLITVSCLGVCGVGPVVVIDEDLYGNVTPDQLPEILSHYS